MRKFREIEHLRGVAIVLAVFNHAPLNSFHPWFSGVVGVHLFFVISGFVITLSLLRLLPEGASFRAAWPALKTFFVRRFFRLFPMAAFSAGLALAAATWLNASKVWAAPAEIWHETLLAFTLRYNYVLVGTKRNLIYFWSLNVEEHFYLVYPLLLVAIPWRRARFLVFGIVLLLVACVVRPLTATPYFLGDLLNFVHHFKTHVRVDVLLAGVLLGLAHHYRVFARPRASLGLRVGGQALAALSLLVFVFVHRFFQKSSEWSWTLVGLASTALVYLASLRRGLVLYYPVVGSIFEYLGSRSYCIYLVHIAVWRLFEDARVFLPALNRTAGSLGLSFFYGLAVVGFSELCHRLIEKPLMR